MSTLPSLPAARAVRRLLLLFTCLAVLLPLLPALPGRAGASYQVYINGLRTSYAHASVLPGEWLPLSAQATFNMSDGQWETHGGKLVGVVGHHFDQAYWRSEQPGTYWVGYSTKTPDGRSIRSILTIFALIPYKQLKDGSLNGYLLGSYGGDANSGSAPAIVRDNSNGYQLPKGFIEISSRNREWPISPHFRLGDFIYADDNAGRIYAVVSEKLVQKLELLIDWMQAYHYKIRKFRILDGFRSPHINRSIGRGEFSRHVYGDAADILVDDWNGDGRLDRQDSMILARFVEHFDKSGYYTGGMGVYDTTSSHGPFVHVDTRGYIARW